AFIGTSIDEEEILNGVVRDEEIHAAIIINIRRYNAETLPERLFDIRALAHQRELAAAVVVVEEARRWLEHPRNTVVFPSEFVVSASEPLLGPVIHETAQE